MPETTHALVCRRDAAQSVLDRRVGQPFRWGKNDCLTLAADILTQLGHEAPLEKAGDYGSAMGARKALKAAGFTSVAEALDSLGLPRIPPAAALPGDIIAVPGGNKLEALFVVLGNGRALGFHEDSPGVCVMQPASFTAAWRVEPRG